MMKKTCLVTLLILGLSTVASAQTVDLVIASLNGAPINPVSEITIDRSDTVNMDVVYTGLAQDWMIGISVQVTATGPGTLDFGDLTFPEGAWDMDPAWSEGVVEVVAGKDYTANYGFGMAGTGLLLTGTEGIPIDHILLHCDDDGPVVVTIANYMLGAGTAVARGGIPIAVEFGPGVTIHQIPEPMTVALLGLGGLALLRRRK